VEADVAALAPAAEPAADFDAFDSAFDFAMLSFFMYCVAWPGARTTS
jgi:hypothetical protein